ncbi:MAG TPA: cation:proton antiporter [Polyangiaceae bacterium]|nr:cation:proton antiporter [Polyangiaceae bacterium]
MSGHGATLRKDVGTRVIQAVALATIFALLYLATKVSPELGGKLGVVTALGFLLLAGTLLSELLEIIGLPHLSGYILAGIIGGPHLLHLVDHHTVEALQPINPLSIAMIALSGGAELRMELLRRVARSLTIATVVQVMFVLVTVTGLFMALSPFIPFARDLAFPALFGTALLWGTMAVTRSPSACMGVLSQTKAKGPLAEFSLAFIMTSDVVVVVLLACALMIARPLIMAGSEFSVNDFKVLGHEIVGSIAVGTTIGLMLAAYLRLVGKHFLLLLLAIGFGLTEFLRYVHIDPLLAFMTAGFVVQNLTSQGPKLLHEIEAAATVVFVIFFATAGAHLNVPLLRQMWPIALALCFGRAFFTFIAARISSRIAGDVPVVRQWGFSSLISQAGLALGVAGVISRTFPTIGEGFAAIAIAAVAINEMTGPVLFKLALDRSGESKQEEEMRPSLPG